jgi:hypothetical protein
MRVICDEPVEVWLRDGRPARFVWRGRMYTVMFVLERPPVPAAEPTADTTADPAALQTAPQTESGKGTADGRECWRVEATPERTLPPTTYELCRDVTSDRWSLSRS